MSDLKGHKPHTVIMDEATDQVLSGSSPSEGSHQSPGGPGEVEPSPGKNGELYRLDVVAGRYDPALFDQKGEHLLINEIFYSMQGEGQFAGQACVFIRLAKCNLACKFCDTEFETFQRRAVFDILDTVESLVLGHMLPVHPTPKGIHVDLTGGEPGLQNCGPLITGLQLRGFHVNMETSGSVWAPWMSLLNHITVSPKVPLARIPKELLARLTEVKWVVNAAWLSMFERDPLACFVPGVPNFLQPESNNPKWSTAALKLILRHPKMYRLSLQQHKLIGAP